MFTSLGVQGNNLLIPLGRKSEPPNSDILINFELRNLDREFGGSAEKVYF